MIHRQPGSSPINQRVILAVTTAMNGAASALAEAPASPAGGWDNANDRIRAVSLRRAGRHVGVYTTDRSAIGRIADTRTAPDVMKDDRATIRTMARLDPAGSGAR
jgi:hypothetical protein